MLQQVMQGLSVGDVFVTVDAQISHQTTMLRPLDSF
jgi:hypothetical protein